jgi:ribosomal protein L21
MKAIEINGKIKTYNRLPKNYEVNGTTIVNFNKLSKEEAEGYGFFDVVMPSYDSVTQQISNLHFDGSVFTYDVTDKEFGQDLDTYKANKIKEVKKKTGDLLQPTDWYVTRLAERAIEIPQDIKDERQDILDKADAAELEIAALETIAEVLKYNIVLVEPIDPLGDELV